MVEKFGALAEFDFLYHRSGPQAGQPRGYAFVTFHSPSAARAAMGVLDGKVVLGRRMAVKWAHAQDESLYERSKDKPAPSILSAGKGDTGKGEPAPVSNQSKIAELEAKLKLLDDNALKVDLVPDIGAKAARPTSVTYHFIERKRSGQSGSTSTSTSQTSSRTSQTISRSRPASNPYTKSKPSNRRH